MRFASRSEAGRLLAAQLLAMNLADPVVLALPRGGVPVASEVAGALRAPLDVVLVRKIGVPDQPELAAAAVVDGADQDIVFNDDVMRLVGLGKEDVRRAAAREFAEIDRRRQTYLKGRMPVSVAGRTAILVDDGIATGTTVRAALRALRRRAPGRLVLAVPVAPPDAIAALRPDVDDVVCLAQPVTFYAIGAFYDDFHQLTDAEVVDLLDAAVA